MLELELKCIRRSAVEQVDFSLNSTMGLFNFSNPQYFYPTIEKFFKVPINKPTKNLQLNLGEDLFKIIDENHIVVNNTKIPVFFKHVSLLDPFQYIMGKFNMDGIESRVKQINIVNKLSNPQSSVYVDIFASQIFGYITRTDKCPSFPIFYGSLLGKSDKYKFDITEEYEDLLEYPYFTKKIGFEIEGEPSLEEIEESEYISISESKKEELDNDIEDVEETVWDLHSCHSVFSEEESEQESETEYEDITESDEAQDIYAIIKNVPSGIIIQEKLEGTLYNLLVNNYEYNPTEWKSWFFQICFALAYAQKYVGFYHNDLHTNNVMWVNTDVEYLNYKIDDKYYRVPTFGKLIKIIDYGRSIISVKVKSINSTKVLMSDQLEEDNEAGGQYNWGEYRNICYDEIPPNPSFDIVYLVYNLIDFHDEDDSVGEFMKRILLDKEGKFINVREDGYERFHGFDIYKAIVRKCGSGVPSELLKNELFDLFKVDTEITEKVYSL